MTRTDPLPTRTNRTWVGLVAKLLSPYLDPQLAGGRPPESSLLLAARAQMLVSPAARGAVAGNLTHLLVRARTPPSIRNPGAPLDRHAVAACAGSLQEIIDTLLASRPVSAHGVATIVHLLNDGTGPLYGQRHHALLDGALGEALALMN